jgi:hypothetical protein
MTRKNEGGQALVFAVTTLGILLMGFAGMGIDMGMMRYQKRLLQTAADAAAIAAASNLVYGGVSAAATAAVSQNGFAVATTNLGAACPTTVSNVTMTLNNGPVSGPHQSNASYVEVCVAELQPTFFMRVVGVNSETVSARAVATNLGGGGNTSGCLFTLGSPSNAIEGVNVTGSVSIQGSSCGIVDNGNFNTTGKAFDVCAASFSVEGISGSAGTAGACGGKGLFCTASATCPATGAPAAGDPLAYLTAPAVPADATCPPGSTAWCTLTATGTSVVMPTGTTTTLNPGRYSNIVFGKNSTTTLAPGIYYIDGSPGITFNGAATVTGTGVTFYFTGSATINATGGGSNLDMQVSAPTSGTYAGILMYQDPSDLSPPTLGGDNNTSLTGALYFPSVELTLFGNANLNANSQYSIIVSKALALTGNPVLYLNSNYSGLPGGVSIIKNAVLVE